jgi:hypothetical protein
MVQSLERALRSSTRCADAAAGVTGARRPVRLPKSTVARLLSLARGRRTRSSASTAALAHRTRRSRPIAAVDRARARALARHARPVLVDPGGARRGRRASGCPTATRSTTSTRSSRTTRCRCGDWTAPRAHAHRAVGLVCSPSGRPTRVDAYVARRLAALTRRTVDRPGAAARGCRGDVDDGYAWGLEEYAGGINSVCRAGPGRRGARDRGDPRARPGVPFPARGQGTGSTGRRRCSGREPRAVRLASALG